MNLLMCCPLCDSHGKIRYFIGAQIDVSGLIMDDAQMESMNDLTEKLHATKINGVTDQNGHEDNSSHSTREALDSFLDFVELLNPAELAVVREHGSALFQPVVASRDRAYSNNQRPRIMLEEPKIQSYNISSRTNLQASLAGVYEHVSLLWSRFNSSYTPGKPFTY
jgi:hypothetical protein